MMKVGILGAGISGLSIGKLLYELADVELLERAEVPGGIARTKDIDGVAYHVTGGHCFNSKHQDVLDFVFNEVLGKHEWHNVQRNANIRFRNNEINYPIEFAVKQIHEFDSELAFKITTDFLSAYDDLNYNNLEDWFRKKFGDTLAEEYFLPYNTKIWNKTPKEMSPAWVEGKLPIPDKRSFFNGLLSDAADKMPHANFYYPNTNNQNTFIDALATDLNIICNYNVEQVEFDEVNNTWVVNNDKIYDVLISTLPLNIIPKLINNSPSEILIEADKLKYNKVTTMLWETQGTERTWTYVPQADVLFHRYIHIGSFYNPKKNYSITETVGEKSYNDMVESGKKDPFLKTPLAYHVSEHAYVVFDENYDSSTNLIKKYLQDIGVYTLGRFGEWQYYNMDICIKQSIELSKLIKQKI